MTPSRRAKLILWGIALIAVALGVGAYPPVTPRQLWYDDAVGGTYAILTIYNVSVLIAAYGLTRE